MSLGNLKLLYVVNWANLKQQQITTVACDKETTWAKVAETCRSRLRSPFANIRRFICNASASFRSWRCWSWDKMLFEFREARESSRGFWNPARQNMHEKGHVNFPVVLHTKFASLLNSLHTYVLNVAIYTNYLPEKGECASLIPVVQKWKPWAVRLFEGQDICHHLPHIEPIPKYLPHPTTIYSSLVSPCKMIIFGGSLSGPPKWTKASSPTTYWPTEISQVMTRKPLLMVQKSCAGWAWWHLRVGAIPVGSVGSGGSG